MRSHHPKHLQQVLACALTLPAQSPSKITQSSVGVLRPMQHNMLNTLAQLDTVAH